MDIYPHDLGEERTVALMQYRAATAHMQQSGYSTATRAALKTSPPEIVPIVRTATEKPAGFWTRLWAGGTNLSPDAARHAIKNMSGTIGGLAGALGGGGISLLVPGLVFAATVDKGVPGLVLATVGISMAALGFGLPRHLFSQYANTPLTLGEAEMLAEATNNPTEKAYLSVIGEVLRQPALPNSQTEKEVRAALQTLGEAIGKLPRVSAPHLSAETLQAEAQKAYAEADAETDNLVAASLRRRGDAQIKTAQAAQKTALVVRRANALRSEIDAQIEALRMGLSGFDTGFGGGTQNQADAQNAAAHLNQLAQSVQGVAREAGSLLDARDEVAMWTEESHTPHTEYAPSELPTRPTETPKETVITVGRAGR